MQLRKEIFWEFRPIIPKLNTDHVFNFPRNFLSGKIQVE